MVLASLSDEAQSDDDLSDQEQDRFHDDLVRQQTSSRRRRGSLSSSVRPAGKFVINFIDVNFAAVMQKDYRWEKLHWLEKRRRNILLKSEEPVWKILLSFDGTVVRILVYDMLFWTTIWIYIGIRLLVNFHDGLPDYLQDVPVDTISVLGGFMSFFLIFWVNQSYSRFLSLYEASMAMEGKILDVATIVVTVFPHAQATRLVRYMNAAHAACYVGLSEVYPSWTYFNTVSKQMGLLTKPERARMDEMDLDNGGCCYRELIVWCMSEIQKAQSKGVVDSILADKLRDHILGLRSGAAKLYDAKDLPIPFFYVHFICLLTTLYLPLFAITAAIQAGTGDNISWVNSTIRGLTVVLQAIFVIGLRVLGQNLGDPYGDDLIDLSVMHFVHFTWQNSNRILKSHIPDDVQEPVEDTLQRTREPLGDAWGEPDKKKEGASQHFKMGA